MSTLSNRKMNEEDRQWDALNSINSKLDRLAEKLSGISRLDEKISSIIHTLDSQERRLNEHSDRLRTCEIVHSKCSATLEKTLEDRINEEVVEELSNDVTIIKERLAKEDGIRSFRNKVLKWVAGILSGIFIIKLSKT